MLLICFIGPDCDCQIFRPFGFTEERAINQAIQLRLNVHGGEEEALLAQSDEEMSDDQFTELLKAHASSQISGPHRKMVVSRASIWETALPYFKRKKFADSKGLVAVTFATFEEEEDAIDLGGPRREFLHLLLGAVCNDSKTVIGTFNDSFCFLFLPFIKLKIHKKFREQKRSVGVA